MKKVLVVCISLVFVTCCFGIGIGNADVDDGLVAYYPFSGNLGDVSEYDNDGSADGGFFTVDRDGKPLSAYYLDGSSQIVAPDGSITSFGEGDFTYSVWINSEDITSYKDVIGKHVGNTLNGFGYILSIVSGHPCFYNYSAGGDGSGGVCLSDTILTNRWYHIVGVRSGDFVSIYMDGGFIADDYGANSRSTSSDAPLYIGSRGINYKFIGKIDDVMIFNRALSEQEIAELYNTGSLPNPPPEDCELIDTDQDGVIDVWDVCSDTPADTLVDKTGCPVTGYFSQAELDQAVMDAEAAKDQIITTKDETIENLHATIASMYNEEQLNQAVLTVEAAKDVIIAEKDATITNLNSTIGQMEATISGLKAEIDNLNAKIASMYTKDQLDQAVSEAEAAKNEIIEELKRQLTESESKISDLTESLQAVFDDPQFSIPGGSIEEQIENLVIAIEGLNHGQLQALYENLGGIKGKKGKK